MRTCIPPTERDVWNIAQKLERHLAYENGKVLYRTDARHAAYPGFYSRGPYAAPSPRGERDGLPAGPGLPHGDSTGDDD